MTYELPLMEFQRVLSGDASPPYFLASPPLAGLDRGLIRVNPPPLKFGRRVGRIGCRSGVVLDIRVRL